MKTHRLKQSISRIKKPLRSKTTFTLKFATIVRVQDKSTITFVAYALPKKCIATQTINVLPV